MFRLVSIAAVALSLVACAAPQYQQAPAPGYMPPMRAGTQPPNAASALIPACVVNTGEATYRFNAVNGVKFGPDQCTRYLSKQVPLPPPAAMSVIP